MPDGSFQQTTATKVLWPRRREFKTLGEAISSIDAEFEKALPGPRNWVPSGPWNGVAGEMDEVVRRGDR